MQEAWKKDKLSFIIIVVLVFAIGWIGDKALGSYNLPNLSGLISETARTYLVRDPVSALQSSSQSVQNGHG